jgi:cysteine-S-conjugate beta-lyase
MKYDFDRVYDRGNTDCIKWDLVRRQFTCGEFSRPDVISMGIADMDFPVAEPIHDALKRRVEHPFYGYTVPGPDVAEAVVERAERKLGWKIDPEWVVFFPGVVPAVHVAVKSLTHPGDQVVVQPPVYHPFFPAVTSQGCGIVNNQLRFAEGRYEMDFDDLERKFSSRGGPFASPNCVKAIVLCNPHNPIGRVWDRADLIRMGDIALEHGAVVISDEIHCDIVYRGFRHVSFATISQDFEQNSIVCLAPSKTYNLAGLQTSTIIIPNKRLRDDFICAGAEIPHPNLFGYLAMKVAYRECDDWLEQLLDYLQGNRDFLVDFVTRRVPAIKVVPPQGTYMAWLDFRALGMDDQTLDRFTKESLGLELGQGPLFGEGGSGFQRMNFACPRSMLAEALSRIEKAVI